MTSAAAPTALSPHLAKLESEAIGILREVGFSARRPVLLTSLGKDSAVVLHLARKAFFPGRLPFPLMHVDTGWKFQAMLDYRDQLAQQPGIELLVYANPEGARRGISPLASGAALHTQVMKTEALRQALDLHGFDVIIGGARRDEEKSRAKERVFSLRGPGHSWNPRDQRPELWALWNTRLGEGETLRVFPVSDWTERDIWDYILAEEIPLVPLYFAAPRPVLHRGGTLIMRDDDRMPLAPGETPEIRNIRFRTLGCWPLTGAIDSHAATVADIVEELRASQASERAGRLIDGEGEASMERRKREGYF
jgi:sulfate adenylyltransferase subunit 2